METRAKIMVVDDEERICRNVEKILRKGNYEIESATSADEALAKMAGESFSLLISDIIMPKKNGLELLKIVKEQWPLTKAVMMTAYASTDTAVKAIRMGALDYVPKPFTPDELRDTVARALRGELIEADTGERERRAIDVIDIDVPFDRGEVADVAGEEYADMLGPSDMPVVEVKAREPLENFCETGAMVCDIFAKLGVTCKAGTKKGACPRRKAKAEPAPEDRRFDSGKMIGIDMPFDYREVVSVTGPEYVVNLDADGVSRPSYAELKENVGRLLKTRRPIDADIPFDRDEVARYTGENYADTLGPSDMPVVEVVARQPLENFCEVGEMVCDIFRKLGATCKAGVKTSACPRRKAEAKPAARPEPAFDAARYMGPGLPFEFEELAATAGRDYAENLIYDGTAQIPYDRLKENVAGMLAPAESGAAKDAGTRRFPDAPATRHILVIDDEVAVNNNIRKILSKKGYHVDQAVTRDEALERIASRDYKLVLLDLRIPGVRGLELLKAVRDRNPHTRVIMITGYASIETAVEAARMGAVDYLPKPFTPAEIRDATARALQLAA